MSRPAHSFKTIAGVPVHYDRLSDPRFAYGTRGQPRTWNATPAFHALLEKAFEELWKVCPLGKAEVITTAGAYVAKPGAHGLGRGFDVDGIFWKTFITLQYPADKRFYTSVEAILRKYFGNVLNYEYDKPHRDHFHVDDLTAPSFRTTSKARVLFLQMALTHVFDRPVGIDGTMGAQTNTAARGLLIDLGLASPQEVSDAGRLHAHLNQRWMAFLDRTAEKGFGGVAATAPEPTPLDLIHGVYAAITREMAAVPGRKHVETALTTFVEDPRTAAWLKQF